MDLGNGLAGTHGEPLLQGEGSLCPLSTFRLSLTNALENASCFLTLGFATVYLPFNGGTLVPDISPPGLFIGLGTGPLGEITLQRPLPDLGSGGFSMYFQYWIVDPAGPQGFSASNAVEAMVP